MLDVFDDLLNEDYAEEWKEVEEVCFLFIILLLFIFFFFVDSRPSFW